MKLTINLTTHNGNLIGIAPIEPIVQEVTTQIEPESEPIVPTDKKL
jgi:hypothetical protein